MNSTEKCNFDGKTRELLERFTTPLAVYQLIGNQIVTILVSDGFCKLLGYADREQAVWDMDHDMYKDTHPDDRQRFLDAVTPENIIKSTENTRIYSVPFRRVFDNGVRYYRVDFAKLNLPGGKTSIVTGFKNVDEEVRKDQQIQQALHMRAAVIEALTRHYDSVWIVKDLETQRFELVRVDEQMSHRLPAQAAVKIQKFYDAFTFYSRLVLEEDRQRFLDAVTPESILKNTENNSVYSVPFRRVFEEGIRHYRVEFARMDLGNGEINIVVGFKDVEDQVMQR